MIFENLYKNMSTDIILSDRKKDYYQDNQFLCDYDCDYIN